MYPNLRNFACEKTWGLQSRKYSLPPRAQFCATGVEAELRGGTEAVKKIWARNNLLPLFVLGTKDRGQKGTQNENRVFAWLPESKEKG